MAGETNLALLLAGLTASIRPGRFVIVTIDRRAELGQGIEALIREPAGTTAVVRIDTASLNGWDYDVELAWLTLDVHSSVEAVGLTAAVARELALHGIASNFLSGYYHDHILVPKANAAEAKAVIDALGARSQAG